jgi:hypothetical protein
MRAALRLPHSSSNSSGRRLSDSGRLSLLLLWGRPLLLLRLRTGLQHVLQQSALGLCLLCCCCCCWCCCCSRDAWHGWLLLCCTYTLNSSILFSIKVHLVLLLLLLLLVLVLLLLLVSVCWGRCSYTGRLAVCKELCRHTPLQQCCSVARSHAQHLVCFLVCCWRTAAAAHGFRAHASCCRTQGHNAPHHAIQPLLVLPGMCIVSRQLTVLPLCQVVYRLQQRL